MLTNKRNFQFVSATIFAALLAAQSVSAARAEVRVSGSMDAVTVEAKNAPFATVISTLNKRLDTRISVHPAVSRQITGTYSGSVRNVLSRMLGGYNYILSANGGHFKLTILAPGAPSHPPIARAETSAQATPPAPPAKVETRSGIQGFLGSWFPRSKNESSKK